MGFLGPDTPGLGERTNCSPVTQSQIAATLAAFLGLDYRAASLEPRQRSMTFCHDKPAVWRDIAERENMLMYEKWFPIAKRSRRRRVLLWIGVVGALFSSGFSLGGPSGTIGWA